jgi:23S rRNA (pseudouridine1915-N3)-methyltransferase
MQIKLIFTGKTENNYLKYEILEYFKRINHYISLEIKEITGLKNVKNLSPDIQKIKEGELILKNILIKDYIVLLDEKGCQYSSDEFALFIENKLSTGLKNLYFIVGGPFGFSDDVNKRANMCISLSKLTFPHQLVRIIFIEQLYRAFTIIKREKYHHN